MENNIKNYNPNMSYRRFGKTEQTLSVITLGGMRYVHGNEKPKDDVPKEMIEQCKNNVIWAMDSGINHIETASGYGKSEHCYSIVLNKELKLNRDSYYFMTKGAADTASDMRRLVEEQLDILKMDYFDSYAWHGINNLELCATACKSGGAVEELLKMKQEGLIKAVGFSTHAPLTAITRAIGTELFDFVNLHYYYFFQRNLGAIHLAEEQDMGVFIISPNDKGGQLFYAPEKLRKITAPLTPIQWNGRFCLKNRCVHTLSFGMTEKSHYDEAMGIMPANPFFDDHDQSVLQKLDQLKRQDPLWNYEGYDLYGDPSGINLPEMLRFYRMWKHYDMKTFVTYRYNMLEQKNHWFPGEFATAEKIALIDETKIPKKLPLKSMLNELHTSHYQPKQK